MTETAHRVQQIELAPGETIEGYGYNPEDVLTADDATYTSGGKRQDLLRLWVISEVDVDG